MLRLVTQPLLDEDERKLRARIVTLARFRARALERLLATQDAVDLRLARRAVQGLARLGGGRR